ncbi:ubiquinol-cytochrome-c reductase complex assembly factor 1 isoform X3 [Eublepharis macularius]|uniref:Ubiquinol-cytochrome-c reductase complex assembly factor 1 isoform X3 n=1 Tax=Eublepharis macularius TaxID=481883 RepID=A0AA97JGC5_EUBMA|nr:ubiquinol-cytochrome-c reductase complex assembly factor 1 isoform X3 [Eublepharis macularius]
MYLMMRITITALTYRCSRQISAPLRAANKKHRAGEPQWITLCSGLIQTTIAQAQWGRMLHGTLQRHKNGRSQLTKVCYGLIQTIGAAEQPSRAFHHTKKLLATKDYVQPSEEKVSAFTKIIEAMGFTGPLKYNKWIDSVALKESMRSMTENFYAAIFGYDEGILSDDHVLAAAIWRNLFNKQCDDPRHLEIMVEYVRKQVQHLDAMPGEDLLLSGEITWRPLVETNAQSIVKPTSPTYNDEGL